VSHYIERSADRWLLRFQPRLKAVVIDGAKGVGKTESGKRLARVTYELDNIDVREALVAQFERLQQGPFPVLIDEWQQLPRIWDVIRRMVDKGASPGSYILTGSHQSKNTTLHSGAGRIVRFRMRPLALAERFDYLDRVSLEEIFKGEHTDNPELDSPVKFSDYMDEVVKTGFPEIYSADEDLRSMLIDSYIENIATREFQAQGISLRHPESLIRWMTAYAAATGTTTSYNKILDAATAGEDNKPSKPSTIAYREALGSLWLIDDLPAWMEGEDFMGRLKQTPKHYLADPGIEARLLGLSSDDLQRGRAVVGNPEYGSIAGRLFESLCAMSVRTYASTIGARVYHLRTASGHREIDLVIERDRKVVALEVKIGGSVSNDDVRHLNWFEEKVGDRVVEKIILTTGKVAYRRKEDRVLVVPAALLGP